MILVTGATGTVGREVVRRLPADRPVRIMVRDPRRAAEVAPSAQIVVADYADEHALFRALEHVTRVFLVTSPVAQGDDERFVRAAQLAGIRHVVKLSAAAVTDPEADDLITRRQRAREDLLRGSGLEWTLLRPRAFMSNTLSWASSIRTDGVVRALYGSSPVACVDPRDIAEVAVRVLTEDGHGGRSYQITGPRAVTAMEQTAELSRLLGRPLCFEELGEERARTVLRAGHPEPVVEALLSSARRQLCGAKTGVTRTVDDVTGYPARPFRSWAQDHLAAFV
ncbi:NAD(P)H-binding protein [Streptomyces sp. NPDC054794]